MKALNNPWVKLLLAILILSAIFLILRSLNVDFSKITSDEFKEKIDSYGVWGPIAYIIFYIIRPLILFPAAVLSASAGVVWGPFKGFVILQIAANLSANGEFFVARYFARGAVEKFLKGKAMNVDSAIQKHGFLTVLLVRLIPNAPWDIQNLSLGLTKVKFRHYFIATLIGIMPGSFALVFFGASIIKVLTNPKNIWMIGVAVVLFVGVFYLQKFLKKKQRDRISS